MAIETPIEHANGHVAAVERISADDYAYYRRCLDTLRQAQSTFQHWGAFLCERYGISARDRINEDGTVERNVIGAETP